MSENTENTENIKNGGKEDRRNNAANLPEFEVCVPAAEYGFRILKTAEEFSAAGAVGRLYYVFTQLDGSALCAMPGTEVFETVIEGAYGNAVPYRYMLRGEFSRLFRPQRRSRIRNRHSRKECLRREAPL